MTSSETTVNKICKIFFESASESVIVANDKGKILLANPRTCEMFGYNMQELVDQPVELLMPDRYRKQHKNHTKNFTQHPSRRSMGIGMTLLGKRKNGEEFPIEVSLNHLLDEGKMYITALITDVTIRKNIEDQIIHLNKTLEQKVQERTANLKESEALYSLIARNFPNGTINVFDRKLNYVFVDGEDLYKMGIKSEHLVGSSYIKRVPSEVADMILENLRGVFEGEAKSFEIKLKKGVYQLNAVPLPSTGKQIDRILVVEQNITKKKLLEENMRIALEKEKELNELKSRFVSMASHEFRTPLSTILSSANLALKYNQYEQVDNREKHLKRIKSNVQTLTSILNDFLSLSKLEEGKIQASFIEFNLLNLIQELKEDLEESAAKNQKIEVLYQGSNMVISDANIIKNILVNLLSNALKYSEPSKNVYVNARVSDQIHIQIQDQGIGIPKEEQEHLFERFFRASNVINIQGTGLGLNIVKKYIDLLQGSITFESFENKGTIFTIQIPVHHE